MKVGVFSSIFVSISFLTSVSLLEAEPLFGVVTPRTDS
jgi:hypothetical protein